jgi:DNA helicase-2/ATP-dependent DNA helicase PcrA
MSNKLNKEQQQAVEYIDGSLLILAGAGTGKPSTITHRLAYLVNLGIDPSSILTLTFTNKAALEMRNRSFALLSGSLNSSPLLCTFHKFGLLFLQLYIHKLGRQNNFIIIDKADRSKILKSIDNSLAPSYVSSCISEFKNSGFLSSSENNLHHIKDYEKILTIYKNYEKLLADDNLLDFDDLILLPFVIMERFKEVREEVSSKYTYVMVDEFQDTNDLQLNLIKQICGKNNNICVVGDDDQSIYSWRGANIKNILEFDKHFKETKKIILNQNYRSSIEILDFANDIISANSNRYSKELKSNIGNKEKVDIIYSNNEHEEGMKIANTINRLKKEGTKISNMAILFRVHAISRSIEEYLNKFNIAYKIIGGIKFYERAEIKDIIAYFRVIELEDDFSLKRIINVPKRGIGKRSVEKIEIASKKKNMKIFDFIITADDNELESIVGARNKRSIKEFAEKIQFLQEIVKNKPKSLSYFIR